MQLSSPLRAQHLEAKDAIAIQDIERRTVGCQVSSGDFPDSCSMSSDSSEDSDNWLMEDMFEQSQSNTSYDKTHSSYGSHISQLEDEEDIWRLWDGSKDTPSPEPLLYPVTSDPIQVREQGQLGTTRKLPSQIQFDTTESPKTNQLKRCSATRSPRRITRARVHPPSPVAKTSYSPFPPGTTKVANLHQDYHMNYHSWPVPNEPQARPQRLRANTTPTPAVPSIRKVSRSSNLSTCKILNQSHVSSPADITLPLFMSSAPTSPQFTPFPERDLMDLMVETSAFSDDEDDEDNAPVFVVAMKSVLNLGRGSSKVEGEKLPVEKAKKKDPRRTLRGALKSFLKKKKGATL
ncbi:hypothetical protein DL95DRAFT_467462 [Leptodontidium sp. 2 PMI_412]|nr:hypothetical protein DL95DRAFT_467462 [Leptodontidium sp. 2 PMI_412]